MAGLQQLGVATASDVVTQWLLINAGFQKEFDPVQTVATAATSGVVGAAGKAGVDKMQAGIAARSGAPGGKVPAAAKPEAPGGVPTTAKPEVPEGEVPAAAKPGAPEGEVPRPNLTEFADPSREELRKLTRKDRRADLARRNAGIEGLAKQHPVSASYKSAEVGEAGSSDYVKTFQKTNPDVGDDVEIHHAVEQAVYDRWLGLFTREQINSAQNLRGIPKEISSSLHKSLIRTEWNSFYKKHEAIAPTFEEVLAHATMIDRKYGGLFKPPL